jgi:chromosome segregation ATPase
MLSKENRKLALELQLLSEQKIDVTIRIAALSHELEEQTYQTQLSQEALNHSKVVHEQELSRLCADYEHKLAQLGVSFKDDIDLERRRFKSQEEGFSRREQDFMHNLKSIEEVHANAERRAREQIIELEEKHSQRESTLHKELKVKELAIDRFSSRVTELTEENESLRHQAAPELGIKEQLAAAALEQQVRDLTAQVAELMSVKSELRKNHETQGLLIEEYKLQAGDLVAKLQHSEAKLETVSNDLKRTCLEKTVLSEKLVNKSTEAESLSRELQRLQETMREQFEAELAVLKIRVRGLEADARQAEAKLSHQIRESEEDIARLRRLSVESSAQLDSVKTELASREQEASKLRQEKDNILTELASREQEARKLRQEKDNILTELASREQEASKLRRGLVEKSDKDRVLPDELSKSFKAKTDILIAESVRLHVAKDAAEKEKTILQNRLRVLESEKNSSQKSCNKQTELQKKVEELELEVYTLKINDNKRNEEINETKKNHETLLQELTASKASHAKVLEQNIHIEHKLTKLGNSKKKLEKVHLELDTKFQQTLEQLHDKQRECADLQQKILSERSVHSAAATSSKQTQIWRTATIVAVVASAGLLWFNSHRTDSS